MAEVHISQASRDAFKARLATPEGKKALDDLARLIVESALDVMPPDLLATLDTKEGMAAFREAWPDIVNAFLFRGGSKPPARTGGERGTKSAVMRGRIPAK